MSSETNLVKALNRIQVLLIFLVCAALLFIQTKKCWDRYQRKETGMSLEIESSTEMSAFPHFSVCAHYNDAYKEDFLLEHGLTPSDYRKGRVGINVDMDMAEFHDRATRDPNEVIRRVDIETIGGDPVTGSRAFNFFPVLNDTSTIWSQMRDLMLGRCYTLEMPGDLVKRGIIRIKFHMFQSPYVYVHYPGQFESIDSTGKVAATLEKKTFIDTEAIEITHLIENDDPRLGFVCNGSSEYNFDHCLHEAAGEDLAAEYGCVPPFLAHYSWTTCKHFQRQNITERMFAQFWTLMNLNQTDRCHLPCASLRVAYGQPAYDILKRPGESFLKLYFKRNVRVWRANYTYGTVSMLAEVGGYMGLLLGFSCFDIAGLVAKAIRKYKEGR